MIAKCKMDKLDAKTMELLFIREGEHIVNGQKNIVCFSMRFLWLFTGIANARLSKPAFSCPTSTKQTLI